MSLLREHDPARVLDHAVCACGRLTASHPGRRTGLARPARREGVR
ncbi:hypothetical protein ACH4NF_14530 [Streptomyces sp. NPDC017248]